MRSVSNAASAGRVMNMGEDQQFLQQAMALDP
jgi:hypothetical protein